MNLALLEHSDALFARAVGSAALVEAARLASDEDGITTDRLESALRGMEDGIAAAEETLSLLVEIGRQLEEIVADALVNFSFEDLRAMRPVLIDYIDRTRLTNERHFPDAHALERAYRDLASRDAFTPDAWSVFHERFLRLQDADRRLKAQRDIHLHLAETHLLPALDARLRDLAPPSLPLDKAVADVARRYATVMEYLGR